MNDTRPVWLTDDDYEAIDTLSGYFLPGDLAYDWIRSMQKRAHAAPARAMNSAKTACLEVLEGHVSACHSDEAAEAVLAALGMPAEHTTGSES